MTRKQKESTAKYLYDISKGIALLAVVGNISKNTAIKIENRKQQSWCQVLTFDIHHFTPLESPAACGGD